MSDSKLLNENASKTYLICWFACIFFTLYIILLLLLRNTNLTTIFVQLFEKLSLQENLAHGEPQKKQQTGEQCAERQPACSANTGEDSGTAEPEPSQDVEGKRDGGVISAVARDPAARRKTYGKVHTRHINQLFIRGENVILVNPQPL